MPTITLPEVIEDAEEVGRLSVSNMEVMDGFGEVTIGCNVGYLSVVTFVANRG